MKLYKLSEKFDYSINFFAQNIRRIYTTRIIKSAFFQTKIHTI